MENTNMTEDLRQRTFKYFSDRNIELPVAVQNAINDAFDEHDFDHNYPDDDAVSIYSKTDIDEFEGDTNVFTEIEVQVGNGYSSGDIINKYSLYGTLSIAGAYTEYINLYNGDELIDNVKSIEKSRNNKLEDPNDFCVILLEEEIFGEGNFEAIPRLYIYVPKEWSDNDGSEVR